MAERLRQLLRWCGQVLALLWRHVVGMFRRLFGAVSRSFRLGAVRREVAAGERERRQVFESLGKMVFLLYKRNLVRNPDLLAECEKITAIDHHIDEQMELARAIRNEVDRPGDAAADRLVAAVPVELPWAEEHADSAASATSG